MRHLKKGRKLGRTQSHRKALLMNLSMALFLHKRIKTTLIKAKELRGYAERLITFAKRGDLSARRHIARFIHDSATVQTLFSDIAPKFSDRPGGYTRIIRIGQRHSDAAPMAFIELVGFETYFRKKLEEQAKKKEKSKEKQKTEKTEKPAEKTSADE